MEQTTLNQPTFLAPTRDSDGGPFFGGDPREIRRVLSTLIGNLPGVVYRCRNDRNWTMIFISDGAHELTGYRPSDFTRQQIHYDQVIHPEDREGVWNDVQEAVRRKQPYHLIYRIIPAGGGEKWVWEQGCGIFDRDGELVNLEGYVTDITPRMTAEHERWATTCLLETIRIVQSHFISEMNPGALFTDLIQNLVELSQSEFGFIGEIRSTETGHRYVKIQAMANVAWDQRTRDFFKKYAPDEMEFHNLETLYGAVVKSGQPVIANDPAHDPRRGGLPPGHPPLTSFTGLPLHHGERLVGVVGLANRAGGYDKKVIEYLQPLLTTCAGIVEAHRNIALRKSAEDALRESERRYRDLFENALEMIQSVSPKGQLLFVNRAWLETLGYSDEEVKSLSIFEIIHPDSLEHCRKVFERVMAGEAVLNIRSIFTARDGRKVYVEGSASPRFVDGVVVASHGFFRDVTERLRLEHEVLEIRESEQRRIGQDLHDGLGQHLTGIALLGRALQNKLREEGAAGAEMAGDLVRMVGEASRQTRMLSKGLHPVSVESEGLTTALEELAENAGELFGISCVARCDRSIRPPDHAAAVHLYRIVQEAVNNAVRHGRARKIEILLARDGETGRLEIRDDGAGMPAEGARREGMGLRIMRYRARAIGGSLDVHKNIPGGVSIVCAFPGQGTESVSGVFHAERTAEEPEKKGANSHR